MARIRSICNRSRFLSAFLCLICAHAQDAHVELRDGEFRLTGWPGLTQSPPAGWESLFRIYAGSAETPMLGSYSVESNALVFHPRFPLNGDIGYHGVFPGGGFVFDAPPRKAPTTRVERIYPAAETLPANTLKLYFYFSAPMSAGEAWQHLHLLDATGQELHDVFLEIEQELWDEAHQRLTVLFDPGRIKRGLVPAREAGTPIVAARRYTLVIDKDWRDAHGVPLLEGAQKSFAGAPPDRTPPDIHTWRISPPPAGTSQPLVVKFPKPMDHALLQRMLSVPGVTGSIATENDNEWRFVPAAPWQAGDYRLTADPRLEDIAGNRLNGPFDADTNAPVGNPDYSVAFTIRYSSRPETSPASPPGAPR